MTFQDDLRRSQFRRASAEAEAISTVPRDARAVCIAHEIVYDNEVVLTHYIVSPGFPYDKSNWRVARIDQWGPSGHETSDSAGRPYDTIYDAIIDILFTHPKAVIAEYVDSRGQRHTLVPTKACDVQGKPALNEACLAQYDAKPVGLTFASLSANKYLWLLDHYYSHPEIPVPTPESAETYVAQALLEFAGGTLEGLREKAQFMREKGSIEYTPDGDPFGFDALIGAGDWIQQHRPALSGPGSTIAKVAVPIILFTPAEEIAAATIATSLLADSKKTKRK